MPIIDLHCHTTASDGLVAPEDLAAHAATLGVNVIAVTDHDTVAGVEPAVRAGRRLGVRVVAGIELSTHHQGRDIHLLGYFIDITSDPLVAATKGTREQRERRAVMIVERLQDLGYRIGMQDVEAQASGDVIARPHIARALVAAGHVPSVRAAFTSEFIGDGGRAYVPRESMTTTEAVALVRRARGVPVVAHPGVVHHDGAAALIDEATAAELASAGLEGLEVYHPDHPPLVRDRLLSLTGELGLVPTGGSDWHGLPEHTLGGWTTPEESFVRLEALAAARAGD